MRVAVISSETAKSLERPVTRQLRRSVNGFGPRVEEVHRIDRRGKVAQSARWRLNLDVLQELHGHHGLEMLVHWAFNAR